EGVDVVDLLEQLEPDRSLPGDHLLVLERVDEGRAALVGVVERVGQALVEARAGELDPGAVVARRLDLRHGRVLGDEDGRGNAGLPRGPGDRLAVVARAGRDDARGAILVREERDPVDGAADLECAGALEVLRLQQYLSAGQARQRLRRIDGGDARDARD